MLTYNWFRPDPGEAADHYEWAGARRLADAAQIQAPLIRGGLGDDRLGTMNLERWRTLANELAGLGLLGRVDPRRAFVNP